MANQLRQHLRKAKEVTNLSNMGSSCLHQNLPGISLSFLVLVILDMITCRLCNKCASLLPKRVQWPSRIQFGFTTAGLWIDFPIFLLQYFKINLYRELDRKMVFSFSRECSGSLEFDCGHRRFFLYYTTRNQVTSLKTQSKQAIK